MIWEIYNDPPEGFFIDKHTGSPLSGYDFYTNGKSVLNGQKRILVRAPHIPYDNRIFGNYSVNELKSKNKEPKQDPMTNQDVRQKVNALARNKFKVKLLEEIEFDLMVCKLEGWSMESYVCELKLLIDDVYRKMIKKKKRRSGNVNELEIEFKIN